MRFNIEAGQSFNLCHNNVSGKNISKSWGMGSGGRLFFFMIESPSFQEFILFRGLALWAS